MKEKEKKVKAVGAVGAPRAHTSAYVGNFGVHALKKLLLQHSIMSTPRSSSFALYPANLMKIFYSH